ncbi:MAG: hypothetical protein Q7S47_02920, partial [bacterium]|nr:hypothetical protein [bacterium]
IMKVFAFSDTNKWVLSSCYYYAGAPGDMLANRDYFSFTAKLSEQKALSMEECNGVQLISNE